MVDFTVKYKTGQGQEEAVGHVFIKDLRDAVALNRGDKEALARFRLDAMALLAQCDVYLGAIYRQEAEERVRKSDEGR